MLLDRLRHPIVLAPLAGGPFTPELAAAVSQSGGLGFVASGYLTAEQTQARIRATAALTSEPLGVNLFVPGRPSDQAAYLRYATRLHEWGRRKQAPIGEPAYSDDDWEAKLTLLSQTPVEVVSFTFGCPDFEVVRRMHAAGSEVWVTVTSVAEARSAAQAGADVLVVQGAEAGGHQGSFLDDPAAPPPLGLLPLLALVADAVPVPLVAAGGIATGSSIAAVLAAGARAAQLGSAFMLCPEASTSPVHRAALASPRATALTRAFTGRLARGIENEFMREHGAHAPSAYPEIHYMTAPVRAQARERGDGELVNLWAGEAHELARELPAAELVQTLADEAADAMRQALSGPLRHAQ